MRIAVETNGNGEPPRVIVDEPDVPASIVGLILSETGLSILKNDALMRIRDEEDKKVVVAKSLPSRLFVPPMGDSPNKPN